MKKERPFILDKKCKDDKNVFIGREICRVSHSIGRMMTSSQRHHYIETASATYGWVIGFIAHSEGEVYQRDIEKAFNIRRSSVSKMLTSMERKGLISRERVHDDARLKRIMLTPAAEEIHMLAEEDRLCVENALLSGIDPDELSVFYRVLDQVESNAEAYTEESRKGEKDIHDKTTG